MPGVPDRATPPVNGGAKALSNEAFVRTRDAVRTVERWGRDKPQRQRLDRSPWTVSVAIARATSTITARSGATVGHGDATFQSLAGYTLSDASTSLEVLNIVNRTIASGAYLILVWVLGRWWVAVVGSCTDLS